MNDFIITTRDLNPQKNLGGVGNYYTCIRPFLSTTVRYKYIGKRFKDKTPVAIRLISDYFRLWIKLKNANLLVVNPSLNKNCIYRDGVSSIIAQLRNKLFVVFFRGWAPEIEKKIDNSAYFKYWIRKTFLRANHIIVLSSQFKNKLREWGYQGPITIETTAVDDRLVEGFTLHESRAQKPQNSCHLLYLGNISKAKGVWEVISAYEQLTHPQKTSDIQLLIAGGGTELENLKEYVIQKKLQVSFPGYVKGEVKTNAYINADLYVFPSTHGEGMPNSVLEAMAFGLPIITTRVGGIPDFFEDGKMGLFLDNRDPGHIAEKIQYLLDRPELMKQMSEYNYNYAKEHFYASKVAKRLEKIIDSVIDQNTKEESWIK